MTCPSCDGPTHETLEPSVLLYGDPPVGLPYVAPVIHCSKCGGFTDHRAEAVREAVATAWANRPTK